MSLSFTVSLLYGKPTTTVLDHNKSANGRFLQENGDNDSHAKDGPDGTKTYV